MPPHLSQSRNFPSSQKGTGVSSLNTAKMVMENSDLDDLPQSLLMEILSRLPVKSLLQLKSVCKNWYDLIANPIFISIHFHHHSKESHLLVHHHHPHTGDSDFSFLNSQSPSAIMPSPLQDSDFSWEIVGPLNGLFLLYNHQEKAAIWNPGTREFKLIIQESGFPYSDSLRLYSQVFGFGIDPLSNEYKVVRVSDFWDNSANNWHNPIVSVYSLSTDSWRHFEEDSSNIRARNTVKSCCKTFWDGCCYWKATDNRRIFEFDMRNEQFQEIQIPEQFKSRQGDLGLYGGSVAMFFHDFVDKTKMCVDIWGMERGKCCWSMKVRIGPFVSIKRPLGYGENGEIFLENAMSKVAVVVPGSQEIKVFGPMKTLQGCFLGVFDYKESLVSIRSLVLNPKTMYSTSISL